MTDDDLTALVAEIMAGPGPVRLVAVDGRGGAGKTTFAGRLSAAAGGAPVVHTDDFASDEPVDWWPHLLDQVIEPLVAGEPAAVGAAPIVIIEGVSAGRREWAEHLSYVIWIETPTAERLRRALERDGREAAHDWARYEAEEDTHFARDPVRERADLVVDDV